MCRDRPVIFGLDIVFFSEYCDISSLQVVSSFCVWYKHC